MAPQRAEAAPVLERPDANGAVAARGRQARRPDRDRGDRVLVTRHLVNHAPARGVPEADDAVGPAGGDQATAGYDGQARRESGVPCPRPGLPPGRQVPEGERAVLDAHDHEAPVREQGERAHGTVGDGQRAVELARGGVPQAHLGAAPGRDRPSVRREREGRHGALQAAHRAQGRRRSHAGGRDVAVELLAASERERALELRQGLGSLAQGLVDAAQQLVGPRSAGVGGAGFLQAVEKLGVRQAALDPGGEARVVGGLDVLCLGLQGAAPQRRGLGGAAEVHQRNGAVAERVRRAATASRLPSRIGASRQLLPGGPQAVDHLDEVVGTILGPLLEAPGQQIRDALGHRRPAAGGEAVSPIGVEHRGRREAVLPRAPAEERFEHREAEAPQVGPTVERAARGLLGREVGRRPAPAALDRHRLARARAGGSLDSDGAGPGQPEVGDLGEPVGGEHHVGRLHVPVHEALLVRVMEPPRELDRDVENGLGGVEAPGAYRVVQAAAVHVLREDERDRGDAADVVAGDHVRVQAEVDPRLGLALEEIGSPRSVQGGGERRLDGEVEVPAAVPHAVDAAHAALPEDALDLVEPQHHLARLPGDAAGRRRSHCGSRLDPGGRERAVIREGRGDGSGLGHGGLGHVGVGDRRGGLEGGLGRRRGGGHGEARGAAGAAHRPAGEARRDAIGRGAAGRATDRQEGGLGHRARALLAVRPRTRGRSGNGATARRRARGRSPRREPPEPTGRAAAAARRRP